LTRLERAASLNAVKQLRTVNRSTTAMPSPDRRARQKAALRQEILAAARELFAQEGYEQVSMRRIAEKIDYSPTTLYLHFQDKAELLFHVCEETFAKLVAKGEKIRAEKGDPLTKLKRIGRDYIEFGLKHPGHYKVTFMVQHEPGSLDEHYEHSMGHRMFALLESSVAECMERGAFRRVDLRLASQTLWAGVHGITSLLIARPDFPWTETERTIALLLEVICAGFARDLNPSATGAQESTAPPRVYPSAKLQTANLTL
jgi:AcrR family transcriptional regulator